MAQPRFQPFYMRVAGSLLTRLLVSVLLGLLFLAAHFVNRGAELFTDWSGFLAALITTAMLCLYYATHTLQSLFPKMDERLELDEGVSPEGETREKGHVYLTPLVRILSDRNFCRAGLFFGVVNVMFGFLFGLPYSDLAARATIVLGYFLAGFVCGMAVWGIWGMLVALRSFSRNARDYDFTSPDGCGGSRFLGDALVVFSSVTLVAGVMISVYIVRTEWGNPDTWWFSMVKVFWIAFPYVASLTALLVPAADIRTSLRQYQLDRDQTFNAKLNALRKQVEGHGMDEKKRQVLDDEIKYLEGRKKRLSKMRTWPFSRAASTKYTIVFCVNLVVSARAVQHLFNSV